MNDFVKRSFDIIICSTVLVLVAPLMLLIACWIKLDSKGPVLFFQLRSGFHGTEFRVIKFRTMVHHSIDSIDDCNNPAVNDDQDPRITRAGRFLRSSSLDELPQLVNILKGDMSLVGPRPVLMEQKELVPPGYMNRFSVRPGLTGLAQVCGRRGLDWLEQLALDSYYVKRHNFFSDLVIIFKTVKVVLLRRNIYGSEGHNWRDYRDRLSGRPPQNKDVEEVTK